MALYLRDANDNELASNQMRLNYRVILVNSITLKNNNIDTHTISGRFSQVSFGSFIQCGTHVS